MPELTLLDSSHGFTAGDLVTAGYTAVVPAFQSIYFADGRAAGFHKLNFNNTKITGVASGAFSRGEVMTQTNSGATGIFDESVGNNHFIYRTTTVEFSVGELVSGSISTETVTPSAVTAPPHWLDWTTRRLASPAAATGLVADATDYLPAGGSNIGCLFSGRIFLNSILNPNQWLATRHRDPCDMEVSQSDVGTPVSSQTAKLGEVGDVITAMVPYLDHYLYFGCADEIWVLRGDPGSGAQLTNVSREVGMFGPTSWTFDAEGNLFFMGMDGFYFLPAFSAAKGIAPENLTNKRLPNLVRSIGLNRRTDRVVMAYDKDRYGINVSISQMDGAYGVGFFWDLRLNAFVPDSFAADQYAASMMYYDSRKASTRGLLMGGQDGYIRKFDDDQKNDDGDTTIDAYCTLGPFQAFNKMRRNGQIAEQSLRLSDDTDGVDVANYSGDAAEAVVNAIKNADVPQATETLTGGGRRPVMRPRNAGAVHALHLRNNTSGERFALERVTVRITDAGKTKG